MSEDRWTILDPRAAPGDGRNHAMVKRDSLGFWSLIDGTMGTDGNVEHYSGPVLLNDAELAVLLQMARSEEATDGPR